MKRKAILIGSPGGTPYLDGVDPDLTNMITFLTSANGGSWRMQDEIVRIPNLNPNYSEIEDELNSLRSCDFSFLYFSGHGYSDSNNNAKINLNENEVLFVNDLALLCKKQITIIDACRSYSRYYHADGGQSDETAKLFSFDTNNLSTARQIFDTYLSNCSSGNVLLHASQVGQSAEDTAIGGYFSTNILRSSKDLAKTSSEPIINIYTVFDEAFKRTQNKHQPQISSSNRDALTLPFVVNPYVRLLPEKSTYESGITLEDVAKIALGTFAVIGAATIIIKLLTRDNKK